MLYRGIIAVCSEIHTKHINTLCGQNVELYIKIQSVPRSKHSVSVIQTSQLMLYREIIAVCSEIHKNYTHCGRDVEFWMLTLMVHKVTMGFKALRHALKSRLHFIYTLSYTSDGLLPDFPLRPEFIPSPVRVGFVLDKVTWVQVLPQELVSPVIVIAALLYKNSLICHRHFMFSC
jgi:hypothetical protein